ncbi:MAG: LamB/YcsF family protein [Christensenellaceae bacterium]|jgi:UPF0271 protein|nr:LamB/YcsF family protein [Christensenellaceae bacterium]
MKIDLNCDLGESFGAYTIGSDTEVIKNITSANVACGFHAGDPLVMAKTVATCKALNVAVGAHPGHPDLVGFGRRVLDVSPDEAKASVMYQVGALNAFCVANGIKMQHVKPHGALYNQAGKDYALAKAICEGVKAVDDSLILLGLAGSAMLTAAKDLGLQFRSEVFADRGYEDDGSLVKRGKPGAMITDEAEAIARVIRMVKEGVVKTVTGKDIEIHADSVCVHGDGAKALAFVASLKAEFIKNGIVLASMK